MNIKHLIFALFTAATLSSLVSCDESTPQPTPETCVSCENETIVDSLFEYEMVVQKHVYDREGEFTKYILVRLDSEGNYEVTPNTFLVPCPELTNEYKVEGLEVIITGYRKSCTGLLTDPETRPAYGSKLELVSIIKK
ncbi:hypothetical protein WAF17_17800 [Bernardetia sp. ABR2-2B]|uniref:hypothetical protein n=1 Tax=Bernardetia sp. ABR2-2B TaxID=3127472 RepID=UPI0030D0014A